MNTLQQLFHSREERLDDPVQLVQAQFLCFLNKNKTLSQLRREKCCFLRNVFMCSCPTWSLFSDPAHNFSSTDRSLPLLIGESSAQLRHRPAGTGEKKQVFSFLCSSKRHFEPWTIPCKNVRKSDSISPLPSKPVLSILFGRKTTA